MLSSRAEQSFEIPVSHFPQCFFFGNVCNKSARRIFQMYSKDRASPVCWWGHVHTPKSQFARSGNACLRSRDLHVCKTALASLATWSLLSCGDVR